MNTYNYQIEDLLNEFGVVLTNDYGLIKNRPVRLVENLFQIGEDTKTFDRWANSVDLEFDVYKASDIRQLRRWFVDNLITNSSNR